MGALSGIRVLEMAAIGPVPFCGMLLADMGAEVLRIDRLGEAQTPFPVDHRKDAVGRGRRSAAIDIKNPAGRDAVLSLCTKADVLLEGLRPGVMERLGLGPDACAARNPKLVYGRATGWGQTGPLAQTAGHDINYVAVAGMLNGIGHKDTRPVPPLNLVGDYGGGGMLLALGVLAALLEASRSGKGQVVDAAMVDGAALMGTVFHGLVAMGQWQDKRGVNFLDGGCFYYDTYETADGRFMAVGALEEKFFQLLLKGLGLAAADYPARENPKNWPAYRARFDAVFRTKSQADWTKIFAGTDACVTPVLTMTEAAAHTQATDRAAFVDVGGVKQPAPAPRFSRTPSAVTAPPPSPGEHTSIALQSWGLSSDELRKLGACGAIGR